MVQPFNQLFLRLRLPLSNIRWSWGATAWQTSHSNLSRREDWRHRVCTLRAGVLLPSEATAIRVVSH
jgi:hypothetical protein